MSRTDLHRVTPTRARRFESGFTLIEMMVGLAIGLLLTLVIAQVLVASEGRRRTTTAGSDAQVNGALALYTLQRDLQTSGYGMTTAIEALGCEIRAQFNGTNLSWVLAPAVINTGASGAPDTIQIMYSAKLSYAVPTKVIEDHPRTAANFFTNTALGIADGNLMIAVPKVIDANNWCSVFNVTGTGGANPQVQHNSGGQGPWNQSGGQTIFPLAGYPAGSFLVDMGTLVRRSYSVSGNALQLASFDSATAGSSADTAFPQIVNLKALYGKDTNADGVVDAYDAVTPTTNAGWRQVLSIRLAVVVRSVQYEREDVTPALPAWDVGTDATVAGTLPCGASKCLTLQVNGGADWKRYRYKVYDTVVPLRNMLWRS